MSTIGECRFKVKRLQMPLELFSVRNTVDDSTDVEQRRIENARFMRNLLFFFQWRNYWPRRPRNAGRGAAGPLGPKLWHYFLLKI